MRHGPPERVAPPQDDPTEIDEKKRNALLAQAADVAIGEEAIIHMICHPACLYAARKPLSVTP